MKLRIALLAAIVMHIGSIASAQDTTQSYPWRLSYFPYVNASPNDGLMGIARAVWFQQSRWDDRVSVARQVSVDAGFSTRNAWMVAVNAAMPRLASGWRAQGELRVDRTADYPMASWPDAAAHSQHAAFELSRAVTDKAWVALRGEAAGLQFSTQHETDVMVRAAAVMDTRDREYDPHRGVLLQGGFFAGHNRDAFSGQAVAPVSRGYTGAYVDGAIWLQPFTPTRVTVRGVWQTMSNHGGILAQRRVPAWEDDIVVLGGPQSSRVLPIAETIGPEVELLSGEVRQDVKVFPAGAIALIAFVDAGRIVDTFDDISIDVPPGSAAAIRTPLPSAWTVGAGGGIAVRLLRNAIITATVGRAEHATRFYISSGWSW